MTQFQTDTVPLNDDANDISKASVCFVNRCPFHSPVLP